MTYVVVVLKSNLPYKLNDNGLIYSNILRRRNSFDNIPKEIITTDKAHNKIVKHTINPCCTVCSCELYAVGGFFFVGIQ